MKAMLLFFFDHRGIVHYEFAPEGQTFNQDSYLAVLRSLWDAVRRNRPEMLSAESWVLHHDSAPTNIALSIRQFLAKYSITTLPQPPYSPDLSPPIFSLFPKLNLTLRGKRFQTVEDIIINEMKDLKTIP
jgi:hypothetical protein